MKPIGLTMKDVRLSPRTGQAGGELMIVHQCLNCGRISCNRIAGDDNAHSIIRLLEDSANLSGDLIALLRQMSIWLLTLDDKPAILTGLHGYAACEYSG